MCTILIPVLNEEEMIPKALERLVLLDDFDYLFIDGGSTDQTLSLLEHAQLKVLKLELENPSIGKGLRIAFDQVETPFSLIVPIDCFLKKQDFEELGQWLKRGILWGGFEKRYSSQSFFSRLYSKIQNFLRSRLFNNLVWTNAIFGKTSLIKSSLSGEGFLEDVLLSDRLKEISQPLILKGPIEVSDRKYKNRVIKRVFINLLVMVLFRLKLKSIAELREIYR